MDKCKVSVITVVYNNKDFIKDAIQSVLSQTYPNIEHIIVDGGSTDGTIDIIESYKDKISKHISEPDEGIYDAMNKGIKMATGHIVGILNADDIFYDNNVIEDIVKAFEDNNIDCCYGNLIYVDRDDINKVTRKWTSRDFKEGLFERSWTPAHPTFYCKREMFEKFGFYRLDFKIAADIELMYRFLQNHKIKSKYLNRFMVRMRSAGVSNKGLKSTMIITKEMRTAITENGGKFNLIKYLFFKALKIRQILFKHQLN